MKNYSRRQKNNMKNYPECNELMVQLMLSSLISYLLHCSYDGAIKIWDENKFLMTEVMLEESLSAACFLNDMGDLLVAFKNHVFYIDHGRCKILILIIYIKIS